MKRTSASRRRSEIVLPPRRIRLMGNHQIHRSKVKDRTTRAASGLSSPRSAMLLQRAKFQDSMAANKVAWSILKAMAKWATRRTIRILPTPKVVKSINRVSRVCAGRTRFADSHRRSPKPQLLMTLYLHAVSFAPLAMTQHRYPRWEWRI